MKRLCAALLFLSAALSAFGGADPEKIPQLTPQEAQQRVEAGTAVLIDVREASEWEEGVATPARLQSLSSLRGDRSEWKDTLSEEPKKELILYCRSGNRSGKAAEILAKEGYSVANAGAFEAWKKAGLPVRKP